MLKRTLIILSMILSITALSIISCGDDVRSPEEPDDHNDEVIIDAGGDEDTKDANDIGEDTGADVRSCTHPTLPIPIPCRDYRDTGDEDSSGEDADTDTTEDTNSQGDGDCLECGDSDSDPDGDSGDHDGDGDGDSDGDSDSGSADESTEDFSCDELFPGDLTCHASAEVGMCQVCRNHFGVEGEDLFACVQWKMDHLGLGC